MTTKSTHQTSVRLARNCWVPPNAQLLERCAAAARSCGSDAVIAGPTAGLLHGLWLPAMGPTIHLATVDPRLAARRLPRTKRPEFVAHRWTAPSADTTVVDGVAVTTIARTWRDLSAVLGLPALVAAGDSALRLGTCVDELRSAVAQAGGRRHVRRSRAALELLDGRSESRPESHLRMAVSAPGLPRFEVNEDVYRVGGGWLARPDLSLERARIALEYQGVDHADPERMRRDLTRAADLRDEGWLVLAYGPSEVFRRPWQIENEVRLAVRARSPKLHTVRRVAS